ncbi:MAG TPA: DUF1592 domain-containing protein [Polyangiaceae bacterium]|nr:DUF1592 domain-containing protein [Polyangiaceae bacterium]
MKRLSKRGRLARLVGGLVVGFVLSGCTGEIGGPSQSSAADSSNGSGNTATSDGASGSTTSSATTDGGGDPTSGTTTSTTGGSGDPGVIQPGGEGAGAFITGTSCETAGVDAAASVLRRLTRIEYQLTLQDLLQLSEPPNVEAVPGDVAQAGFTAYAELHTISSTLLRAYLQVAQEQADLLFSDPDRLEQVVGCDVATAGCLDSFVTEFGELAYRRPLTADEIASITTRAEAVGVDAEDQLRYALEVLLTSPNFLYRVELGDATEGLSNLTAREVASRLSFATWGRAPSAELLSQADAGALDTPEGLQAAATEMLADPRAQVFFETFFREWLNYDEMKAPKEPAADWTAELMPSMQAETDAFLADFAWTAGSDFFGALTANHTFVTPALATYYGLPTPGADGRVEFPAGSPRSNTGLLSHASVLSAKSDGDSVALRGNWLRSTFLCEELYIDAAQLDAIGEELVGLTRMEIIEERNTRVQCKSCHAAIDPIGVGFEQFDPSGRFDASVDLSSYPVAPAFPDAADPSFDSVAQLGQKLAAMPEAAACLSSRVFLYAHGRDPGPQDSCAVEQSTKDFIGSQRGFSNLLLGLIEAPAFRLRRAAVPE